MKLVICTKFQVNQMYFVESRRGAGGGPIDPPSRLCVTIFSRRLLGLIKETQKKNRCFKEKSYSEKNPAVTMIASTNLCILIILSRPLTTFVRP